MNRLALIGILSLLTGCSLFSGSKKDIIEVGNQSQLDGCLFLEKYTWPAGDVAFGTPSTGNAKNAALDKAQKQGATHFLYRTELKGEGIGAVGAVYAFQCPPGYDAMEGSDQIE